MIRGVRDEVRPDRRNSAKFSAGLRLRSLPMNVLTTGTFMSDAAG
jgi:hypothetical protein